MTHYLDIIANRRVVSSETIVVNGKRLCASLTTLELAPDGDKTQLKSTTQLASFIGEDMVKGHQRAPTPRSTTWCDIFRNERGTRSNPGPLSMCLPGIFAAVGCSRVLPSSIAQVGNIRLAPRMRARLAADQAMLFALKGVYRVSNLAPPAMLTWRPKREKAVNDGHQIKKP